MICMVVGLGDMWRARDEARRKECKYGICSECGGTGRVEVDETYIEEDRYEYTYGSCPKCNGTGKIR